MVGSMLALRDLVEHTLEEFDKRVASESELESADDLQLLSKEIKVEELIENDDTLFLMKVKDRLVVLFEGLQDKNIVDLDSKLQMTLDFLEYLLADIEDRLKEKSSE